MRFSDEAIAVIPQNDSLETIIRLIKNKSVMTICYVERKSKGKGNESRKVKAGDFQMNK